MKIIGDYHTHTVYSHGKGSIEDNVKVAIRKGLKEIAICDHGPAHYLYGVKKEEIFKMRDEIDSLNKKYGGGDFKILLGVEANVIGYDGTIDVDNDILEAIDILLVGYHYGVSPKSLRDGLTMYLLNPITKLLPIYRNNMIRKNTEALIRAMDKYPIRLITHPGSKAKLDIEMLGRAAYKKDVALEINSRHSQLTVENIRIALKTGVKFYIGSDAHTSEDVANLDQGIRRAKEANVPIDRIINLAK